MSTSNQDNASDNPGLLRSIASLGASFVGLAKTRVELIVTEFEEEKERRKEMAILALVMAVFSCIGLQLFAGFIIVCFWNAYGLLAVGGVTLLYLGIGLWAFLALRNKIRNRPRAFASTLEEFENDAQGLHAFVQDFFHRNPKAAEPKPSDNSQK